MNLVSVGETAIAIRVEGESTSECVHEARRIRDTIRAFKDKQIRSVRAGLDCVLVEFWDKADQDFLSERLSLPEENATLPADQHGAETMEIPVCYDEEYAFDIPAVEERLGLNRNEIINLFSARMYEVWMIGFMPGFPYLGPLALELQMPRKTTPDPRIPEGSVAIAEEYVGIYPFDSPGGWHVIGRTPWKIFDLSSSVPWKLEAGLHVRFYPIDSREFQQVRI